jgi:hypothetical protein
MGDLIFFGPYLAAKRAAVALPPKRGFMPEKTASEAARIINAPGSDMTDFYVACDMADVEPAKVMEIIEHDGCDVEAAIMAAGAKKRAGY